MRAALGAGRGRLVRQLLTESLLLAALGGALGMVVAEVGVSRARGAQPAGAAARSARSASTAPCSRSQSAHHDARSACCVGLIPALHASRSDLHAALQQGSRRTAGGHRRRARALVVAEVALALVLLVGAGLLLRSLERLFAVDSGLRRVATADDAGADVRATDSTTTRRRIGSSTQALDGRPRRCPASTAAAFTSQLPLSGDLDEYGVHFESSPTRPARRSQRVSLCRERPAISRRWASRFAAAGCSTRATSPARRRPC